MIMSTVNHQNSLKGTLKPIMQLLMPKQLYHVFYRKNKLSKQLLTKLQLFHIQPFYFSPAAINTDPIPIKAVPKVVIL